MASKNVAVKRIHIEGILGDIRGRQTLPQRLTLSAIKSCLLLRDEDVQDPRMDRRGKWVGSKFAACMWIHTKMVLTEWRKPTPEMQEYLKRRMLSIMLRANWVCAETFDDHESVSEGTIAEQEQEVMGRELDYDICIPRVVQWSMLWFLHSTRANPTLESEEIKTAKYYEIVNMAIAEAISMPFGGLHTPLTCMSPSMAAVCGV